MKLIMKNRKISFIPPEGHDSRISRQELANRIKNMKEGRDFARPEEVPNWKKWSTIVAGSAEWTPNQLRTSCQISPKKPQVKNKWTLDSCTPQPLTHNWASCRITPVQNKFALVGNRFQNCRQANTKTLRGTSFHQRRSAETKTTLLLLLLGGIPPVRVRYAPLTVYPTIESGIHIHTSSLSTLLLLLENVDVEVK